MAQKPFQPHPGSYAEKTVKHLLNREPGLALTRTYLSQFLGVPVSNVHSLLSTSVRYEFLLMEETEAGTACYRLGPAAIAQASMLSGDSTSEQHDDFDKVMQHMVPASEMPPAPTAGVKSVFHLAGVLATEAEPETGDTGPAPQPLVRVAMKSRRVGVSSGLGALANAKPRKKPVAAPAATPVPGIRCGLFNNGDLVIEARRGDVTLDRSEVRELLDYLNKLSNAMEAHR